MAKIAKNLTELIGHTPLMELAEYSRKYGLKQNIIAKLEAFNPAGSVKDRVALAMIEDAEASGTLKPGATIIEPTSGNTGVGLAMVATIKGYHLMLTMPETMSIERRNLLKALGAEIVLTDGLAGMAGSIAKSAGVKGIYSPVRSFFNNLKILLTHRFIRLLQLKKSGRIQTEKWMSLLPEWEQAEPSAEWHVP